MPISILPDEQFKELLKSYRSSLSNSSDLQSSSQSHSSIVQILETILQNPGGLVRAQLCLATIQAGGGDFRTIGLPIALGVEYYHLASLIIDDLPCMDNAEMRRGQPSIHSRFGEASAILAALALINKAYSLLWSVIGKLTVEKQEACAKLLDSSLGATGIIQGQALDLSVDSYTEDSKQLITKIADKKTGTLFRLSIVLPALIVTDNEEELIHLEQLSQLFGRTYQLIDDFKDLYSGAEPVSKTQRDQLLHRPNMVISIGRESARDYLNSLLSLSERAVSQLCRSSSRWEFYRSLWLKLSDNSKPFVQSAA